MKSKVNVLGIEFDNLSQKEFLSTFQHRLAEKKGTFVVTANPEIIMAARENPEFTSMIKKADFVTADGIGVIKGAKILGKPLKERVTGYDLLSELLKIANEFCYSIYFLGAKNEVIKAVVKKINIEYPAIKIVGSHDGYFHDTKQMQEEVIMAKPQLVFAALGAPKQEEFLLSIQSALPDSFLMGVGGSFDVLSGMSKRAPKFMQQAHLEWFYRLLKEPTRWRRMLVLPKFIRLVKQEAKNGK